MQKVVNIVGLCFLAVLGYISISLMIKNKQLISEYEGHKANGGYIRIYQDRTIKSLEHTNKELYDSIKKIKGNENVNFATIIKYKYVHDNDTVYVDRVVEFPKDSVYSFKEDKDTFNYELKIKTKCPIDWYKLKFGVSDKITLINKNVNGQNELSIQTNGGEIDGIQVVSTIKPENKFFNRFSVGLQVGAGYGIFSKQPDLYVGVGLNFKLNQ